MKKKLLVVLVVLVALGGGGWGYYVQSPQYALGQIAASIETRDRAHTEALVKALETNGLRTTLV